jgi:hypothetical protein
VIGSASFFSDQTSRSLSGEMASFNPPSSLTCTPASQTGGGFQNYYQPNVIQVLPHPNALPTERAFTYAANLKIRAIGFAG